MASCEWPVEWTSKAHWLSMISPRNVTMTGSLANEMEAINSTIRSREINRAPDFTFRFIARFLSPFTIEPHLVPWAKHRKTLGHNDQSHIHGFMIVTAD